MKKPEVSIILDNLRSAHNVGAIMRTADGAGVTRVYLTGTTPQPIDRFGRPQPDIAKTALGAEEILPWEYHTDTAELLKKLKNDGVHIVAVEQRSDARDYKQLQLPEKAAVIFGNEVDGISEETLALADVVAEIPMHGKKESLNVSVSAGIVLYRLLDN